MLRRIRGVEGNKKNKLGAHRQKQQTTEQFKKVEKKREREDMQSTLFGEKRRRNAPAVMWRYSYYKTATNTVEREGKETAASEDTASTFNRKSKNSLNQPAGHDGNKNKKCNDSNRCGEKMR